MGKPRGNDAKERMEPMGKFEVAGHEPSLLPEGNWEMVWADEFDGTTLDASKWDYRLNMMGLRWPSWTDKAVHMDGKSNVVFTLIEEDGKPVCSHSTSSANFSSQVAAFRTVAPARPVRPGRTSWRRCCSSV